MKFYQVKQNELIGVTLGNSTRSNGASSPIVNQQYVKIDEAGIVFNLYDNLIPRTRSAGHSHQWLIINQDEIKKYFVECEDPGPKKITNIKFTVIEHDYENVYDIETFDDHMSAIALCVKLNDTTSSSYSVKVEYDTTY